MKYYEVRYNFREEGDGESGPMGISYDGFVVAAKGEKTATRIAAKELKIDGDNFMEKYFDLTPTTKEHYDSYIAYKLETEAMENNPEFQKFMNCNHSDHEEYFRQVNE